MSVLDQCASEIIQGNGMYFAELYSLVLENGGRREGRGYKENTSFCLLSAGYCTLLQHTKLVLGMVLCN